MNKELTYDSKYLIHLLELKRYVEAKEYSYKRLRFWGRKHQAIHNSITIGNFQKAQFLLEQIIFESIDLEELSYEEEHKHLSNLRSVDPEESGYQEPHYMSPEEEFGGNGTWCPACHEDPCECSDPDAE